jgi:hypothetical protein
MVIVVDKKRDRPCDFVSDDGFFLCVVWTLFLLAPPVVIAVFLAPHIFGTMLAALCVLLTVRYMNRYLDPGHANRPPDGR